jgi:hypothetical protein
MVGPVVAVNPWSRSKIWAAASDPATPSRPVPTVVAVTVAALAMSTLVRRGAQVRVVQTRPLAYSFVIVRTASTTTAICPQ